jgi:Right handed beta helix region
MHVWNMRLFRGAFPKANNPWPALAFAALSFIWIVNDAAAQGRTYRVRKDGTGDFTTILACVNAMAGGDTCLVSPGSYQERIRFPAGKSGSAGRLTTIKAETNGSVDIWGADTANCNYVRIEGFNIAVPSTLTGWTDGVGVAVRSSNVEVVSNYIHDTHWAAISGSGNNVTVRGNHTFKCGMGFNLSGSNWLVERNDIERTTKYPEIGDADNMRFFGQNHIIRSNHLFGTLSTEIGSAHVDGFQTFDDGGDIAQHIVIECNLVEGFYHQGLMLEATYRTNTFDITIRNNVFIAPQTYAVAAFRNMRDVKVYNNTVINPEIFGVRIAENSAGEAKNNIFYSAKTGIPDGDIKELTYSADATSTVVGQKNLLYIPSKIISQLTYPNDLVNLNPQFVNLATFDLHLRTNSAAIDRGATLSTVTTDRDGVPRPQGSAWDIGAYEYSTGAQASVPPPTNLRIVPETTGQ